MTRPPGADMFTWLLYQRAGVALLGHLLEEVVSFVVDEDEGGEVLYLNLVDGLHTQLGIFEELDALDAVLGQDGCGTAD